MSTRPLLSEPDLDIVSFRASRVDVKKLEKQEAKLRVRNVMSGSLCCIHVCCVIGQDREAFQENALRRVKIAGPTQETGPSRFSIHESLSFDINSAAIVRGNVHENQSAGRSQCEEQVERHPFTQHRRQFWLQSHSVRALLSHRSATTDLPTAPVHLSPSRMGVGMVSSVATVSESRPSSGISPCARCLFRRTSRSFLSSKRLSVTTRRRSTPCSRPTSGATYSCVRKQSSTRN